MAIKVAAVTNQVAWTIAEDGSSDPSFVRRGTEDEDDTLSDPDYYAHSATLWTGLLGDVDHQRLVVPTAENGNEDGNIVLLRFFGDPASNPAGYAPPPPPPPPPPNCMYMGIGAIWGVSELNATPTEYMGDWLGQFDITIGTHGVESSATLPTDGFFGRRATVRVDRSMIPGIRAFGSQGEASPVLVADGLGYTHLVVELRCVQPANSTAARPGGWAFGNAVVKPATGLGFMYRFM